MAAAAEAQQQGGDAQQQAGQEQQQPAKSGGTTDGNASDGGYVSSGKEGTAARAFQRVKADEWLHKKGSWDNSYEGTFGRNGWGWKAQEVLGKVRCAARRASRAGLLGSAGADPWSWGLLVAGLRGPGWQAAAIPARSPGNVQAV